MTLQTADTSSLDAEADVILHRALVKSPRNSALTIQRDLLSKLLALTLL